jgi:hypothetical protein
MVRGAILWLTVLRYARTAPRMLFCISCASLMGTCIAQAGTVLEAEVKAAYLSKFPAFIEWPRNAFPAPTSSFNLCVVGEDPFGDLLQRAIGNQQIGDRPVEILHPTAPSQFSHCHLMYVAGDETFVSVALSTVRSFPVLTITDSAEDKSAKGIINFVVRDNHVRFEIDRFAAARNALEISSKLLNIAISDSSQ